MSLILDALNRAEHERKTGETVSGIDETVHSADRSANKPWWKKRGFWEIVIILPLLTYLLISLWQNTQQDKVTEKSPEPPAADSVAPAPPATDKHNTATVTAAPQLVPVNPEPPAKTSTASSDSRVASLYQQPPAPTVAEPPAAETVAPLADPQLIEQMEQQARQILSEGETTAPATPIDVRSEQQRTAAPAVQPEPSMPDLYELAWSVRRNIPSIDYQVHVYSDKPGGGFVQLNGSRHRAGDQIAPDLYLREVQVDGIILEYQGKTFRLASLSSWINN